jgi:hypothetical protein
MFGTVAHLQRSLGHLRWGRKTAVVSLASFFYFFGYVTRCMVLTDSTGVPTT